MVYSVTFKNTSKQFAYASAYKFSLLINFEIITMAYDKKIIIQ